MQAAALIAAACCLSIVLPAQQPASALPYTVVSREARRPLAVARRRRPGDVRARRSRAALQPDRPRRRRRRRRSRSRAGAQTIVLSPQQPLASVAGRMISLPAAPVRDGRAWFVPVDFVSRALAPGSYAADRAAQAVAADRSPATSACRASPRASKPLGSRDARHHRRRAADAAHRHAGRTAAARPLRRRRARRRRSARPTPTDTLQGDPPGRRAADARDRSRAALRLVPRRGSARAAPAAARIVIDLIAQTETPAPGAPPPQHRAPAPPPPATRRRCSTCRRPAACARSSIDAGHGGDDTGAKGRAGHAREERHAGGRAAAEGARSRRASACACCSTRDGDHAVRRGPARGARQQQQGGPVHQPARERVGAAGRRRRRGLLPEPRGLRRAGAARIAGRPPKRCRSSAAAAARSRSRRGRLAQARHIEQSTAFARAIEGGAARRACR